jgi:hypothetical protein
MERFNFTKNKISTLPKAEKGHMNMYYDSKVIGLSIRVTATGVKSFRVRKRVEGKYVPKTLGRFPEMTIEQARIDAMKTLNQFSSGIDPNKEARNKKIKGMTLLEVMNDYAHHKKNHIKDKTIRDYQILFDKYLFEWKNNELVGISRSMVEKKHSAIGKK